MSKYPRILLWIGTTLFTINGLAQQSVHARTMLDGQSLVGPVRSVQTITAVAGADINNAAPSRLDIYDRDGFLIERYQYDEQGVVVFHTAITRDHWTVIKEVNESGRPELHKTFVAQGDQRLLVAVPEAHDSSGNLVSKPQGKPAGSFPIARSNNANANDSRTVRETSQYDSATGESLTVFSRNGEVVSQSASQWSKKGDASRTVMPDGSFTEVTVNADGYVTKLHFYIAETQTDALTISDEKGRTLEDTQKSPGSYFKSMFTYDSDGFVATESMLNREGKPTDKFRYQYQKDAQGNWVEQHRLAWHATDASPHWAEDQTIRRIIAYY